MERKKKLLHVLLAMFFILNQFLFCVPLNADETETEPKTTTVTETQAETTKESEKDSSEETTTETAKETRKETDGTTVPSVETSPEQDASITSARNGKEFVKGVSKLPKKYRIAAAYKKGKLKLSGARGVDYGGSCVLSFKNKDDYEAALKELDDNDIDYSVDGSVSVCSTAAAVKTSDAKVNPNAKTKIALIDTGSDIANEKISLLGDDGTDTNGHGTAMSSLILEQTNDAYIISVKAIGDNGKGSLSDVYAALRYAIDHEAEYILMAISIKDSGDYDGFILLVEEALENGIKIIASAGNNNAKASKYLPAGISGVITAGAIDNDGYKIGISNYGKCVDYYLPASSTSEAAAVLAGRLIAGNTKDIANDYRKKGDEAEEDPDDGEGDDEFTINKSKMTWPTKSEMVAAGYYRSSDFGDAVIKACKAMKGVEYGTDNGKADCMRYVNLAYAQALNLISGLKVKNGKIPGLKRSNGNVTYNGTSISKSKYHLVDGCTTWSDKSPHNIGHPGGINIKNNGGLKKSLKKLGAKKGSIILFGGYNSKNVFKWTHAAIYTGSGKKVYDAPGGSMTAGVPYSKSEGGSGSKTYTHVAVLNYADYTLPTKLTITKVSSKASMTTDNACYSLAGTKYGLYNASDELLHEFEIDENGKTDIYQLPNATQKYYLVELSAGRGYVKNEKKIEVSLSSPGSDGTVSFKVSDEPVSSEGKLVLEKNDPEGWYGITGSKMSDAVFRVDYYDSVSIDTYKDIFGSEGEVPLSPKSSAEIKGSAGTNGSGRYEISAATLSAAGGSGYFSKLKGLTQLPLGTYVITEIKAPAGYKLADPSKPLIMKIHQEGYDAVTYYSADPKIFKVLEDKILLNEEVILGQGAFIKRLTPGEDDDADTSAYSLEGTTYNIYHKQSGNLAMTLVFGSDGKVTESSYPDGVKPEKENGTEGPFALPAGDYIAKEIHSGYGIYLDTSEKEFTVSEGSVAEMEFADEPAFTRFDCLIKKVRNSSLSNEVISLIPVEGAEFELSYYAGFYEDDSYKEKTPSRKWVFKTDSEGKLFYDRDHLVKGDDLFVNGAGEFIVPQGTYVLTETKAPSGSTLSQEIRKIVVRFAKDIVKGSSGDPAKAGAAASTTFSDTAADFVNGETEFYNNYETSISTNAVSTANGTKQIAAVSGVSITDTLTYKNLLPGYQYKVRAWLVRSDGTEVVKPFDTVLQINTDEERNGTLKIPFVIDASVLQGETLTVMEEVYITDKDGNEILYAKHDDINNTEQQVTVPYIRTDLIDEKIDQFGSSDNSKLISYGKDVSITDIVTYKNLIAGKKYKISGTLLVKDTGKPLLNSKGKPYTASVEFIPETKDGFVKVVFEHVDTTAFSGSVVCGETLNSDGIDLITHYDIEDKDQTVTVPEIKTSAQDASNKTKTLTYEETADIRDTVTYKGLKPGLKYKITGILMDRSTGKPYTDPDGMQYTRTIEFVPNEADGVTEVLFEKVKISYEYKQIVVFEQLFETKNGIEIAAHEDLNDAEQTVYRPHASTVATGSNGARSITSAGGRTKINDKVMYKGFTPGNTYSAVATLYKTDGTQITDNGVPVTNTVVFTAKKTDGTVTVPLTFDLGTIDYGESVVIFENIYDVATKEEQDAGLQKNDIEIVRHHDLNNKDQTLKYKYPAIPKTGEGTSPAMVAGILVLCSAAGPMGLAIRAKRGAKGRALRRSRRKPSLNSLLCSLKRRMRDGSSRVWRNWSP